MPYQLALELVILEYVTRTNESDWVCAIDR